MMYYTLMINEYDYILIYDILNTYIHFLYIIGINI